MTKSIQQVQQELKQLRSTVANTAIELEELHRDYLNLLNQSLKQQLILACYQICTQIYPRSFLDLSLSEKQNLQQNLRQIAIELEPDLIDIIEQKELEPEPLDLNLMAELIKNLPKSQPSSEDKEENIAEVNLELVKAELENIEFIEIDADSQEETENSLESPPTEKVNLEDPQHLILWHKQVQRNIKKTLDNSSRKVNKCLQKSQILPDRIPSKVIDVAMKADTSKSARNNSQQPNIPHVLHLAFESDKKSKLPKNLVQISLLRLRLAELEFHNPLLNAKRGQIRNLIGKIKKLNHVYLKLEQEAAVLEAQAAWRSSWYED